LVIVQFVESMGGIRAVQTFRRERRNQEIFERVNNDYRAANTVAFQLIAKFSPAIKVIGNITIAVVLTFGGYLVLNGHAEIGVLALGVSLARHGHADIGVLAAFLLSLGRFFEPMQDLSMFYNTLQSASAALEKLAGVLSEKPAVPEPVAPVAVPERRGEITFT